MKSMFFVAGIVVIGIIVVMLKGAGCCSRQKGCCSGQSCCGSNASCCQPGKDNVKESIKQAYGKVAQEGSACSVLGGGCCGGGADLSGEIGYTKEQLEERVAKDANLGLGCGNPVNLGEIKPGSKVGDLGSGAGLDSFLAAIKVGPEGYVVGFDMTPEMIKKARENAKKYEITNVEFRLGDIENLPIEDNTFDILLSNCVLNLVPDKDKAFSEAHRVLKTGGRMYVADVVLLDKLSDEQKNDTKLYCACVSGAILKDEYLSKLEQAGFDVEIVGEDTEIAKKWFNSDELPIESLKFIAIKK